MSDIVFWSAVGAISTITAAFVGFVIRLASRITANKLNADNAMTAANHAHQKIDALIQEFASQREITAKNIGKLEATNDGLAHAMKEMTSSLRHVVERLDRLVDRISADHGG